MRLQKACGKDRTTRWLLKDITISRSDKFDLHGRKCSTATLVFLRIDCRQDTSFSAKSYIPSFLVQMGILGVELIEKSRISNMYFIRSYTDNGSLLCQYLNSFAKFMFSYHTDRGAWRSAWSIALVAQSRNRPRTSSLQQQSWDQETWLADGRPDDKHRDQRRTRRRRRPGQARRVILN